jgi:hypothetical protein
LTPMSDPGSPSVISKLAGLKKTWFFYNIGVTSAGSIIGYFSGSGQKG